MWIHEAVKKALESNKCITLPEFKGTAKIKPTNGKGNCIVMEANGCNPSKHGWQPTAKDLTRNDWEVVTDAENGAQDIHDATLLPEIKEITYYANNEKCQKELRISLSYHDWCLFEKQQCYQNLKRFVQELKLEEKKALSGGVAEKMDKKIQIADEIVESVLKKYDMSALDFMDILDIAKKRGLAGRLIP